MMLKYGYDELNVIMKNVAYIIKNGVAFRLREATLPYISRIQMRKKP